MNRIVVLIGSLSMFTVGTASAQTSVDVSIGFGVPRPYLVGSVFIGRPHLRPVYRLYFYRLHRHRYLAPRPFFYRPYARVLPRGHLRSREGFLRERERFEHRHRDRGFRGEFDRR